MSSDATNTETLPANLFPRDKDDAPDFSRQASATVELIFPRKLNGVETGSVSMRRPTIGDRIRNGKINGTDEDRELALFSDLCMLPPAELLTLDLMDYFRVQETFRSFLGSARPATSDLQS